MKVLLFFFIFMLISCDVQDLDEENGKEYFCDNGDEFSTKFDACKDRQSRVRLSKIIGGLDFTIVNFTRQDISLYGWTVQNDKTLRESEGGVGLSGANIEAGYYQGFFNTKFYKILENAKNGRIYLVDNAGTVIDMVKWNKK